MSEYSQPLSTCSRTTDFSFCFNNSAFSDAVLVLLTLRPKGASITQRLASSVAQLFVSAVEIGATTLTATIPVDPKYGKTLGALSRTVVSGLSPKDGQEVVISTVYQVNSALLAASSPYLRQLIQHPPQLNQLVPGLSSVAARHRQRKLVTVLIQPHHIAAAEHVIRFIFTNDIALTSAQQALDALLVAEQLQVPDCAEVCQHYLEDCSMDWPVALTLVHLQHKHQQEQHHQRQQQWQQQQQQQPSGNLPRGSSGTSIASARRPGHRTSLHSRSSMSSSLLRGLGGSGANGLDAVAPPLPVPSESVYLQGLLLRAQDFLVHEFEDLELVLASAEGRQRLLLLPYDALRAILGHPSLKVASENTALLAAAGWLQANAAQVGSLLLNTSSAGSSGGSSSSLMAFGSKGDEGRVQSVYSSSLYTSSINGVDAPDGAAAASAGGSAEHVKQNGSSGPGAAAVQPEGAAAPPTATGAGSLLLDLCQVLRLCQCSYTYILHVLPQLPLFRDEPCLVAALQFEVLRFRAAGKLRQRRLAAEAAAAAAGAAAANPSLTGHHLAGLQQQQQQPQQLFVRASAGGSGSDSSAEPSKVTPTAPAGPWPAADANAGNALAASASGGQGWRSGCTVDAALLQCQPRPESAGSTLDFTFTFDPQALAGPEAKTGRRSGNNAATGGGSNGGGSSGVDLMQRLLGLTPQQQEDTTVFSQDQYFAGYVWNLVVAADGFVGVSWRVLLPGGVDVPLAGPHQAAAGGAAWQTSDSDGGTGSLRLFGPDCAGFRSAEVAVTFSITSSGLLRVQRSNSSSGSLATATAGPSSGGAAGVDAAVVKPGSKADQSCAASAPAAADKGAQASAQQQQTPGLSGGSPVKSSKVVGRAYSEVQFVPAHCAWGFPDFAKAGWDALKGPDETVCLRCQLKHRE